MAVGPGYIAVLNTHQGMILIMQQTSSLEILKLQRDNLLRGLSGENESVYVPPIADTNQPTITETTDSINAEAINIQVDPLKAMLAGTFIAPETFGEEEDEERYFGLRIIKNHPKYSMKFIFHLPCEIRCRGIFLRKDGASFTQRTYIAAENMVKTVKCCLCAALQEVPPSQLDTALYSFLIDYRIAPYTTTGILPAQALVGGQLRNRLDLLHPPSPIQPLVECGKLKINRGEPMEESVPTPAITLLEKVWVKSYRINESKWISVKVEQILVPQNIQIE
ncbi:unnamed protein product [Timema podura]|uniref:Uncharacterized protein n=1 Tax=Timema podura TaxID=61482 RepID=A0ABN7NN63_TIMPD|nr:unnamed protein product [Timema podura]